MPVRKVTLFFEGFQKGWTESYYLSNDDTHDQVMTQAKGLAQTRAKLLGKECSIKAVRVSTEGVNHDAMLRYVRYPGDNQEASAQPDVALMVRCENATHTKWRNMYLRGVWDRIETDHGKYVGRAIAAWTNAYSGFVERLREDGYGWVTTNVADTVKVTSVARDASGEKLVYTLAVAKFLEDEVNKEKKFQVRFSGINTRSTANGLKVVIPTEPTKCITAAPLAAATYRSGGKATFYTTAFIDISTVEDAKIVTREAGAPLLESVGRRPRQVKA